MGDRSNEWFFGLIVGGYVWLWLFVQSLVAMVDDRSFVGALLFFGLLYFAYWLVMKKH